MFYSINILNNWAFAFSISVPVHIILRSFGSVTTMLAGYIKGKRYSMVQVLSVYLLTVGVLISAWADCESKVCSITSGQLKSCSSDFTQGKSISLESDSSASDFTAGLLILLLAQLMSAYMGAYVEDTYASYKASWTENLFYSHVLSLPLFLPLSRTLQTQFVKLSKTPVLDLRHATVSKQGDWVLDPRSMDFATMILCNLTERVPRGVLFLLVNAATQLACISGVNLLSAKSSAVTVTIVLNIRKLVSFIFSTLLFGHHLSAKMILGASLVFGSGALYGWETSWRLPRERRKALAGGLTHANGTMKKDGTER